MILKRSDVMRRLLDAAADGMPNFEGLMEKLDQLEDPAFWAWWQENEKERHMRDAGWVVKDGQWLNMKPRSANDGGPVTFPRAWEKFRIEQAIQTTLPMMPIFLAFDPAKQDGLKEVLDNPTAWTLWLLWKPRHIVSQHFNMECLRMADRIDSRQPKTPADLRKCFQTFGPCSNFLGRDAEKFCEEAVPFFTGEKEVDIVINPAKP